MAAPFVETLQALLASDNAVRNAAEARYETAKRDSPAVVVSALFQVIASQNLEVAVREQAAVLLRQCCSRLRQPDSVWARLGGDADRANARMQLLLLLEQEPNDKIRRKVADCLQWVANQLIDIDDSARPSNCLDWPELMPTLMRLICDASKDPNVRADVLWTTKELACSVWQVLIASSEQTCQILRMCFADTAERVKANGAGLYCELVSNLPRKEDRQPFASFIPELFAVITQLANSPSSEHVQTVLTSFLSAEEVADFFKEHISSHVLPVLCPLAKSHNDNDVRKLALEVLITLVEGKPKTMVKVPGCIGVVLDVVLAFLMELDDDVEGWSSTDEDQAEPEENYVLGQECFYRISQNLNQVDKLDVVLGWLRSAISHLFGQPGWKGHVAGLAMFAQISEYIDDQASVDQMLSIVTAQLRSHDVRVRYCAWGALQRLAENQQETLADDKWAAALLPDFLGGLDDGCVRVVISCMKAFQHYGEHVEREMLEPVAQTFMQKLGAKLQGSPRLQREAITFIAVIAAQIGDGFAEYYAPLMPILKQVISVALHKAEERVLLGKTFECMSLLANAVGRDAFRADAEAIMQAMMQACSVPDMPKDDPVQEYVMAAAERICSTLREDFVPFMPAVLPHVLGKLTFAPKEYKGNKGEIDWDADDYGVSIVEGDDGNAKILIMSTSELEDLHHALDCIRTFITKLGKHFSPFIAQSAHALLPVFEFDMSESVRDLAFGTWGDLCSCARRLGQPTIIRELCQELMMRIVPKLEQGGLDVEALKTRADGIRVCLEKAGPGILGVEDVRHICQVSLKLVSESLSRRQAPVKKSSGAADDDDDGKDDDGPGGEDELRVGVCNMVIALMEQYPDHFTEAGLPLFLPAVQQLSQRTDCEDEMHLSMLLASGFCEFLGDRGTAQWPSFLPQVLGGMSSSSADIKQTACYVASVAAKMQAFAPYAAVAAQTAAEVIVHARSQGKKKFAKPLQAAADNALSALVEILQNHRTLLADKEATYWTTWLNGLPCQEDVQEGARNNEILLQVATVENPMVLGANGENLPRVLALMVDAYKSDMVDNRTSLAVGLFLQAVDEARLQHCAATFTEKQQKKLLRIRRETQKSIDGYVARQGAHATQP